MPASLKRIKFEIAQLADAISRRYSEYLRCGGLPGVVDPMDTLVAKSLVEATGDRRDIVCLPIAVHDFN